MRWAILLLACSPAFGAYAASATVSFSAASGSTTDTNITLYFTGNDARLKTAANGGLIQNTVLHNGITVPADLIVTNDSTCGSLTGSYTWGFKTYSATAGTLVGRVRIPSLTTGIGVAPTVCIGNSAVSTYQGGSVGGEFDSSVQGCWDFPDGTTLSAVDCSANANSVTLGNTPTATTGQIAGGAAHFTAASSQSAFVSGNPAVLQTTGAMTYECWFNASTLPTMGSQVVLMTKDDAAGTRGPILFLNNTGTTTLWGDIFTTAAPSTDNLAADSTTLSTGTWYYATLVFDPTGPFEFVYLNGVVGTGGQTVVGATQNNPTALVDFAARTSAATQINFLDGSLQSMRVSNTARSADWLLTSYANQVSPPAIGAFSFLKSTSQFPRIN